MAKHTSKILKNVWPFFNMHEKVKWSKTLVISVFVLVGDETKFWRIYNLFLVQDRVLQLRFFE